MHWIALQPLPSSPPEAANLVDDLANDSANDMTDDLVTLGWQALQFSPKVARVRLGANLGEALVMEVSASERLFSGRRALLQRMFKPEGPLSSTQRVRAATALAALARLQLKVEAVVHAAGQAHGQAEKSLGMPLGMVDAQTGMLPAGSTVAAPIAINQLPLHTLAAALPHLGTLARVGCNTWGELRALPRDGVGRRFGGDLLDALDRAYGLKPEIYPWLTLPDVFEAQLELQAQVETAPALLFGARRLLNQLQLWLQLRNAGVLGMEMGWTMDARRNTATQGSLIVRTAESTQDIMHLQRLISEHLAKITLPAPVLYLHLRTLETEKLAGKTASLLLEDIQKGDSLHQMLERVSARLGASSILQLKRHADHRPEQMQAWIPVFDAPKLLSANSAKSAPKTLIKPVIKPTAKGVQPLRTNEESSNSQLYPTWLLAEPLALMVQHNIPFYMGPLTLLKGPHRIETGWWGEAMGDGKLVLRDYYIARNELTGLVWIYRERLSGRPGRTANEWYLHGVFG